MTIPEIRRPHIVLSLDDIDQLQAIAFSALMRAPRLAGALLEEVGRASIVSEPRMASRHAGLGSQVRYWDEAADTVLDRRLVDPRSADRLDGDLPVLSPLGIALIGMGVGQTGLIPDRWGGERRLRVLQVERALP